MSKFKLKFNSERLLSLSAMGISFITLLIFIYQTNLMSKQNYLSIMPYLDLSTTVDGSTSTYEFRLKNHGIGPAIIESVTLIYQGKRHNLAEYNNEWTLFLKKNVPELDSLKYFSSATLNKGMAIPANSDYLFLGIKGSPEDFDLMKKTIEKMLSEGLDYEIVYKSIQDEHWMIHQDSEGPRKLD